MHNSRFQHSFLSLVGLSLVGLAIIIWYINQTKQAEFETHIKRDLLHQTDIYRYSLSDNLAHLEQLSSLIAGNQEVQTLFSGGKKAVEKEGGSNGPESAVYRSKLNDLLGKNWGRFRANYHARQLHFHLAPNVTTFLRVHRPGKFGDQLRDLRPIIASAIEDSEVKKGFELGISGASLRGVSPVYSSSNNNEGQLVGAVETGTSLLTVIKNIEKTSIVDDNENEGEKHEHSIKAVALIDRYQVEKVFSPNILTEKLKSNPFINGYYIESSTDYKSARDLLLTQSISKDILKHGVHIYDALDSPIALASIPLQSFSQIKNSNDESVGHIVIWLDIRHLVNNRSSSLLFEISLAVLGEVLIILFIYFVLLNMKNRMEYIANLNVSLGDSEKRFRGIVETSNDWIWEVDINSRYIYASPSIESLLGYTPEEVIGKTPFDLIDPAEVDKASTFFEEKVSSKKSFSDFENMNIHKDGSNVLLSTSGVPILDDKGTLLGYRGTVRNITSKRAAEILQKEKEIAEETSRSKAEFLATMSHELRTPMHGILSFSKMGLKNPERLTAEKTKKYFSNIKISGDRLLALINDLLDLSKLEAGKMSVDFSIGSLLHVTQGCISEQQARLNELDKHISWDPLSLDCKGSFDQIRIGQVIANLLSNAIKFTPEGEEIVLSISEATMLNKADDKIPALLFTIRDHGEGIPDGEFEIIFDRFSQSSNSKTHKGGTGLGLAICKEIIDSHAGNIWAENHPDGGAVFSFNIPVVQQGNESMSS